MLMRMVRASIGGLLAGMSYSQLKKLYFVKLTPLRKIQSILDSLKSVHVSKVRVLTSLGELYGNEMSAEVNKRVSLSS